MKHVGEVLRDFAGDMAIGVFALLVAVHIGWGRLVLPNDASRPSSIIPFVVAGLMVALLNWIVAWLLHRRRRRGEDWDSWTSPWLAIVWGVLVVSGLLLASPSILSLTKSVPSLMLYQRQTVVLEILFAASGAAVCALSLWMHCMAFGFRYELLNKGKIVSIQTRSVRVIRFPSGNRDALKAEIEWLRTMQQQIFWAYGFVLIGLVLGLDKLPTTLGVSGDSPLPVWFVSGVVLIVLGFHMLVTGPVLHYSYMLLGFLHEYPDTR